MNELSLKFIFRILFALYNTWFVSSYPWFGFRRLKFVNIAAVPARWHDSRWSHVTFSESFTTDCIVTERDMMEFCKQNDLWKYFINKFELNNDNIAQYTRIIWKYTFYVMLLLTRVVTSWHVTFIVPHVTWPWVWGSGYHVTIFPPLLKRLVLNIWFALDALQYRARFCILCSTNLLFVLSKF